MSNLDKLYFGVVLYPLSYGSSQDRKPTVYNLFDFGRVKWAVAKYVTMTPENKKKIEDPAMFCFGSVWGRTEFEFMVCPWPYLEGDKIEDCGAKVDVYEMYVKPNIEHLMELVNSVSVNSAKKCLKENRR